MTLWKLLHEQEENIRVDKHNKLETEERLILLVCTSNICRSPMAEALLSNEIRLAGLVNWRVESRGLFAMEGFPIDPGALLALKELNIDASKHRARQITELEIKKATLILTAEEKHRYLIRELAPSNISKIQRLTCFEKIEEDVWDPHGGSILLFKACLDRISLAVAAIIQNLKSYE